MNKIYLDNAATTEILPEVRKAMGPYLDGDYGNPSSVYVDGRKCKRAIEKAREQVAKAIGANPSEIFFTSGGSESDNWAIKGPALAALRLGRKPHIITSVIEHPAVIETCKWLETLGVRVTYLPVDKWGFVNTIDLIEAITSDTILVSIMTANNEIGTIEPVATLGMLAKRRGVLFHTDAVQAFGSIKIDVKDIQCDLLSLSSHKFHGPKGMGVLYVRNGTDLEPMIHGGHQQMGLRAGTENVAGIVGTGVAAEIAGRKVMENALNMKLSRNYLYYRINRLGIPAIEVNGPTMEGERLPGNLNITLPGIEGETFSLMMDIAGVICSSGSACSSGTGEPSRVILAIGKTREQAFQSIRFSVSPDTTLDDIDEAVNAMVKIIEENTGLSYSN